MSFFAPNKACTRPPLAWVGVPSIPCNQVFLQKYLPLYLAAGNANRWADSLNKGVSMKKYVKGQYYWLDHEKTILSQCVRIDENEVAYFQIIGLSVLYTEKDFEVAIKATVK